MSALPMTLEALQRAAAQGETFKYVFFWGHQPPADGGVGKGCLSQWWPCSFEVDGVRYASAEHYMMAGKARLFDDEEMLEAILATSSPAEAKALGRKVRGFDHDTWARERLAIVTRGNVAKFGQDDALRDYLLGTRRRVLVEASPADRIWGIGLAADDARASDPAQWRGLNLLGFALMAAREELASA